MGAGFYIDSDDVLIFMDIVGAGGGIIDKFKCQFPIYRREDRH